MNEHQTRKTQTASKAVTVLLIVAALMFVAGASEAADQVKQMRSPKHHKGYLSA